MDDTYIKTIADIGPVEYKRLYYGEWVGLTEREQLLEDLAKEYHERCDAYDKRICTAISPRTGEPIPENGSQQGAINVHSLEVRHDILTRYDVTEAELHKAIAAYNRR